MVQRQIHTESFGIFDFKKQILTYTVLFHM